MIILIILYSKGLIMVIICIVMYVVHSNVIIIYVIVGFFSILLPALGADSGWAFGINAPPSK